MYAPARLLIGTIIISSCFVGGTSGVAAGGDLGGPARPGDRLAILSLQEDFHAANTLGDLDLMESIWAEDAVFSNPAMTITGRSAVVAFFANSPGWGVTASLAPTYKTRMELHGNTATLEFECIIFTVGAADPVTVPFSTIPFGGQNPAVAVVQHSNATVTAVKHGKRWLIQSFTGGAGALLP